MPIKIEITGDDAQQTLYELLGLARPLMTGLQVQHAVANAAHGPNQPAPADAPMAVEAPPADTPVDPQPAKRGRKPKAETAPEPVAAPAPEPTPEPTPETAPEPAEDPQDLFDEAPPAAAPKTRDDVKLAMTAYVNAYGMAAGQADLPGIMGFPKFSAIPDDPAAFADVVAKIEAAVKNNPNGRAKVG